MVTEEGPIDGTR